MHGLATLLGRSPEFFPHGLDIPTDTVTFIRLDQADYERASFLDARIIGAGTLRESIPWMRVAAAIAEARLVERCAFIFHIGHVGSTLLSRLIGAHAGAFALREPLLLRTFAQLHGAAPLPHGWTGADLGARLEGCLQLLSRTFAARQRAVVKTTSLVSELAAALLARSATPRAVMMSVAPEVYLATILGGENSRREARMLTPGRCVRLNRRAGGTVWDPARLSEGEAVALGWACETAALAHAAHGRERQVLQLDFDRFLADPPALLLAALLHLDVGATAAEAATIVQGPDMARYSKAPEFAYDSALRRDVLNDARAAHGAEIRRGLAWLDAVASAHDSVRAALEFARSA